MLRTAFTSCRSLSSSALLRNAAPAVSTASKGLPDLTYLKFDSNASKDLYAVCKIHNIPYMVTKGDKLILPYKIRNQEVGDVFKLDNVITLGSRNFTYNDNDGIPQEAYELTATLAEITKEPKYQVVRKKQRCRRKKTTDVEPFQSHLIINELKLK
ncbi:hypothetical protein FT663_04596 [Candidozyma haemuli var. vulneris]|uniref:Large ribosomal subunit protein bL21m n=1 Tax=Candidozyma haemuli TaxID=45357 RepID=A0A2V1ALW8_9ASCO|nr:hypothetical protein CXQ85_000947 [[Candida] haemuloni]KAF3986301.1 hypothetical protein FT662_04632 [[Candida] haemuloni var. vulneris]KAF3987129.1 hypothetical protein FT663_04596 [[Candida] haemuloni var. vulneris]PVH18664.1 hypothetical protein CXQ85_000947 [[Candida] haemuloni]